MSFKLFSEDVLFFQRLLRAEGLYLGALDGDWGPNTEKAANLFLQKSEQLRQHHGSLDTRTESCLSTLSTLAQQHARIAIKKILSNGLTVRIISGTRTYEEQNTLYRKGRFGNPGPIVTNARGGQSNHNFGIAWDIGVFTTSGGYIGDGPQYSQSGNLVKSSIVEWGGEWKKFPDMPHYQLRINMSITELRTRFEEGSLRYQTLLGAS